MLAAVAGCRRAVELVEIREIPELADITSTDLTNAVAVLLAGRHLESWPHSSVAIVDGSRVRRDYVLFALPLAGGEH